MLLRARRARRALHLLLLLILGSLAASCGAEANRPSTTGALATPQAGATPTAGAAGAPSAGTVAGTVTEAPGWRTYTNSGLGYSISLPPGVDFRDGTSPAGIYTARLQFALPGVPGYQGMVLRVEPNPAGHGVEAALAQLYQAAAQEQPPAGLAAQAQALTVSGLSAVRAAGEGGDYTIVVPYGDKVYMLAPVHDAAYAAVDPQTLALFEQILASFRVVQ